MAATPVFLVLIYLSSTNDGNSACQFEPTESKKIQDAQKKTRLIQGFFIYICLYQSQAYAHNWRITPYIQLQEIYSDNINLAPAGKAKSALVTELSPAAHIIWQAGKSNLNLRYNMQNLYNAQGNGDFTIFHQLQFNAHNVLSQNRLFVDSRSSISQQNISNTRLASDNLSGRTATVSTFGISPTWLPHFGNYANGTVRVNADRFSSDANTPVSNGFSDSESISEMIRLNSGSKFKRLSWSAGFNNYQAYRSGGNDVNFQSSNVTLRTHINKHFSIFATGGHSANNFTTQTNTNQNGFFYTFGGRWSPSTHYWLEAGGGNNSYITLNISPMKRLSWLTTVRHNNVGLNSGTTWQTALNYRTRRSTWSLTHYNDTTTVQDMLSMLGSTTINTPSLTDEVIVRESWNLSASFYTGKSSINFNAFNQDRTFQGSASTKPRTEHVRGVNAAWNWQFARKTSAYLSPQWQQIDRADLPITDSRYDFAIGLNQAITNRINGQVEFRHLTQTSDLPSNDYQENRATANLFMRF